MGEFELQTSRQDGEPPVHPQGSGPRSERPSFDSDSSSTVHGDPVTSNQGDRPHRVITFDTTDPEHPNNWSPRKKFFVLAAGIVSVVNSTMGSSLPSNAIEFIAAYFHITNEQQLVLPISCYLMGYIVGPVLCGPISENYGRKPIMLITFAIYTLFTMACAVAPTWWSFLFFRLICGVAASSPIAVVGGMYADIHSDPRKRGMCMAAFMAATACGPISAPALSGFISENVSWRWVFGVGALFAAATFPVICFLPETYVPTLLTQRAAQMSKETGELVIAKTDLQKKSTRYVLTVVMTRPYRMLFQEWIVATTCVYLSLAYAIFYLYFEAYPLIFLGPDSVYGWSPGLAGLTFLPIGIGALVCIGIFYWWDETLDHARRQDKPWARKEEYRRLPLACLGGPLYVIALFWVGWTARRGVHWIVPVLSGIPFGMGFLLIFMALLNYLSDAYKTFAASAMGIASTARSVFGALLPLAARPMFARLGIDWACTLLGLLSLLMSLLPFAFIKWGDTLRANSRFCQELKAWEEMEARQADKPANELSLPVADRTASEKV